MEPRTSERAPSPDAVEFVRFCYRRRRVGWPELYDEMCAVAGKGHFNGWGPDELAAAGIGFSLFEMPALAVLVNRVVADEQEKRAAIAPPSVTRAPLAAVAAITSMAAAGASEVDAVPEPVVEVDLADQPTPAIGLVGAPAGA
ncbi:MAG TPA: hypothetical protein VH723_08915 [Candidatus Limnocylindrales bacterium]|jgi:hypothetical protein